MYSLNCISENYSWTDNTHVISRLNAKTTVILRSFYQTIFPQFQVKFQTKVNVTIESLIDIKSVFLVLALYIIKGLVVHSDIKIAS